MQSIRYTCFAFMAPPARKMETFQFAGPNDLAELGRSGPAALQVVRQRFFVGWADGAEGATAADEAFFCGEAAGANIGGDFLDDCLGFFELLGAAGGFLARVILQIVED